MPVGRISGHSSLVYPAPSFSEGYSQGVRQAMMSSEGATGGGSASKLPECFSEAFSSVRHKDKGLTPLVVAGGCPQLLAMEISPPCFNHSKHVRRARKRIYKEGGKHSLF